MTKPSARECTMAGRYVHDHPPTPFALTLPALLAAYREELLAEFEKLASGTELSARVMPNGSSEGAFMAVASEMRELVAKLRGEA